MVGCWGWKGVHTDNRDERHTCPTLIKHDDTRCPTEYLGIYQTGLSWANNSKARGSDGFINYITQNEREGFYFGVVRVQHIRRMDAERGMQEKCTERKATG